MNTFYIETYGCRMNICDSETIIAILCHAGYRYSKYIDAADIVILNSCSVREDGHNKIFERLGCFKADKSLTDKTIVITGCFASLLDASLFDKYPFVNIIVNPNCYRTLPELLHRCEDGEQHLVASISDNDELYEDILPVREIEDCTTAAINVMKGCNQNCSYCIEPITRGKEHCRSIYSIMNEARDIAQKGYRELTLVGHLIDKYKWTDPEDGSVYDFAMLLDMVAEECPEVRIKFLSSHPSFMNDAIVSVIKKHSNIMHVVHLPVQSGSNEVLRRMHRGYTREQFISRVQEIRAMIPGITVITDIMVGFCGETQDDFEQTVSLVKELEFEDINVFRFSMRSGTKAAALYKDDVSDEEKMRRYDIIRAIRDDIKSRKLSAIIGTDLTVVIEGRNRAGQMYGRDRNHRTVVVDQCAGLEYNDIVDVRVEKVVDGYLCGSLAD